MKRWLRDDAAVDVMFVIGVFVVLGGAWMLSPVHTVLLGGILLIMASVQLRARR